MAILGLIGTEALANYRFTNIRRAVFYDYPNGVASLTGLLSLQDEESTNDPEFSWWEKRLIQQRTTTAAGPSTTGPFTTTADVTLGDAGPGCTITAKTEYRVVVASAAQFRVGQVIRIPVTCESATVNDTVIGVVTNIPAATKIQFKALKSLNAAGGNRPDNGATENVGVEVLVVGSAAQQGQVGAGLAVYNEPKKLYNYTQIFRTAFQITGSALKTSLKYDDTGVYKDQAKDASLDHMRGLEFAQLFGERTVNVDADTNLPTYTMGGILWYLQQWELAASNPYGRAGATLDSDDDKRIITNSKGYITEKEYDEYLERVFRVTNNKANEKLVLCGSGALNTINRMYKGKTMLTADLPLKDTYGMSVVKHVTPFGTVYYKTHPLFSQNQTLRYNMLFIEVGNLKYRYLQGRDTELLTERQPNNADYREDEWLTECGLELRKPETFMYLQNLQDWAP